MIIDNNGLGKSEPIIKPGRESYMSAGSFFKNPVVEKPLFKKIFMKKKLKIILV